MGSTEEGAFGERRLLKWIRGRRRREAGASFLSLETDIGDDAAVLADAHGHAMVVTTDMLVEGVHFRREEGLRRIGRKSMAVSLSDVAAMGCVPRFAVVSAGLPPDLSPDDTRALVAGLDEAAGAFDARVIGGDVVESPTGLTLAVTLLGTGARDRVVRRSGARSGDRILVTGALGGSILGDHLDFTPRVAEGVLLAEGYTIHAMIDVSDGLSTDLHHVLEESGVGARLEAARIPISSAAAEAAGIDGRSPLEHALHDGEDFELLVTLPAPEASRLRAAPPFATPLTDIGEIRPASEGCFLVDESGRETPLEVGGHEHLRG
jgi:thiamine-monophosphate kinase